MEPLEPKMREALKQANPGLTDEDIDRSEEILARLEKLDPEQDAGEIQNLQSDFNKLIRQRMPRYHEVVLAVNRASIQEAKVSRPVPRVIVKTDRRK